MKDITVGKINFNGWTTIANKRVSGHDTWFQLIEFSDAMLDGNQTEVTFFDTQDELMDAFINRVSSMKVEAN